MSVGISDLLNPGRTEAPLAFKVLEQLHEIDLTENPEIRVRRNYDRLRASLHGLTERQALHLAYSQEYLIAELNDHGGVYLGLCCARSETDPHRIVTAQFSVTVQAADLHAERPLAGAAGGLRTPGSPREVVLERFPAGDGLIVAEELLVTVPFGPLGEPAPAEHRVRQAQVSFACPDRRRITTFGLSSESLDDWPYLMEILNGIVNSVSFTDPSSTKSINATLDA
ncbi:hypothetical protein AB0383_28200 [Amycolatopsis sp. NPDC051373]|uniref:hypothetical protein n=1 Tax=Amycolatopsis sp. NPDC051373 TaxID=3155801 RepID=UPI00344D31CD